VHADELGPDLLAPPVLGLQDREFLEEFLGTAVVVIT
jgi:hypothetical protein